MGSGSALRTRGVVVTSHAELGDCRGIWVFVRGDSAVISAPPEWVARLAACFVGAETREAHSPASVRPALGDAAGAVIGPSFQGWLPPGGLRPVPSDAVRRLTESEGALVDAVRSACPPVDWQHGGIDETAAEIWASFEDGLPAALGQLRRRPGGAVDPSLVTRPDRRGRGHGSRLVSAMAQHATAEGRLVLSQTLLANRPALALAARLGFEPYATLLAVRLLP